MSNDESMPPEAPTQPHLIAQKAGAAPLWPLPQQPAATPDAGRTVRWFLLVVVAFLLSFGAGSGLTVLLAHGNGSISAPPSGPSLHSPPTHLTTPTPPPTSAPFVNQPAPTAIPQPTPTHGGGGD